MITAFFDFEAVLLAFLTTAVAVAVLAGISMVGGWVVGCAYLTEHNRAPPVIGLRSSCSACVKIQLHVAPPPPLAQTRLDITSWGTLLVLPSILVVVLVLIGQVTEAVCDSPMLPTQWHQTLNKFKLCRVDELLAAWSSLQGVLGQQVAVPGDSWDCCIAVQCLHRV
jgi:hypothetical protein